MFYNGRKKSAKDFLGKKIKWIVCKECQRKLKKGIVPTLGFHVNKGLLRAAVEAVELDAFAVKIPPEGFVLYNGPKKGYPEKNNELVKK